MHMSSGKHPSFASCLSQKPLYTQAIAPDCPQTFSHCSNNMLTRQILCKHTAVYLATFQYCNFLEQLCFLPFFRSILGNRTVPIDFNYQMKSNGDQIKLHCYKSISHVNYNQRAIFSVHQCTEKDWKEWDMLKRLPQCIILEFPGILNSAHEIIDFD